MSVANTRALDELASHIRHQRAKEASLADVVRLAEISTEAFQAFFAAMDSAVLREMRDIAMYITTMKREIGSLQANDIKDAQLPAAGEELDAIVCATEAATNIIMECAEAVMAAGPADAGAYKALIDEKMIVIFGQRIAKVVETLRHIEDRVARFVSALQVRDIAGPLNQSEIARASRKKRLLLHGPQGDNIGNRQRDVDALLRPERPAGNTQSDIDRLFA